MKNSPWGIGLKLLHANLVIGLYDYLHNNQDITCNGIKEAGSNEALTMDLYPEDPFEEFDIVDIKTSV